jgi:hypothetical protein
MGMIGLLSGLLAKQRSALLAVTEDGEEPKDR